MQEQLEQLAGIAGAAGGHAGAAGWDCRSIWLGLQQQLDQLAGMQGKLEQLAGSSSQQEEDHSGLVLDQMVRGTYTLQAHDNEEFYG